MEIIDINCMVGPWVQHGLRYADREGLEEYLNRYSIQSCVAYTSAAVWNPAVGNPECSLLAADSRGRIAASYIADPALETGYGKPKGAFRLSLTRCRPAAVRMLPSTNGFILDDFFTDTLLETLDDLALPLLLEEVEAPPLAELARLAQRYPRIPLVLLRRGFRESRNLFPLLEKLENVYLDTSMFIDYCFLEKLVEAYGSERLLFGSGLPFYEPSGALGLIAYARIGQGDKENILYRNWRRLQGEVQWS